MSLNALANAARIQQITTKLRTLNTTTQEGQIEQAYYYGTLLRIGFIFERKSLDVDKQNEEEIDELDGLYDEIGGGRLLRQFGLSYFAE